jgi:N-hydroxyarylamine O-acetyltransferase
VSEEANLDAYLRRINYSGSIAPVLETLTLIHQLHPAAIAFENLDPLMDKPVRLQLSDIEQKLINERRGGYCFEHNLLLQAVLETMEFPVTPIAAAVLWGREPGSEPPLDHMALIVDVGGVDYLADVGFGGQVMTAPLRLRADLMQETPNERYRLVGGEPVWRLEAEIGEEWKPLYQFEATPRTMDEFIAMNDLTMGMFRDRLAAARVEGKRRFTLHNARLNTHEAGNTETRMLTSIAEIRDALTNTFLIQLPQAEQLDVALEKALRPGASD